jgi:hypothetical protein
MFSRQCLHILKESIVLKLRERKKRRRSRYEHRKRLFKRAA